MLKIELVLGDIPKGLLHRKELTKKDIATVLMKLKLPKNSRIISIKKFE